MRLIAKNLTGVRGETEVFTNVGFDVASGGAVLITGANGAGKSTLLRIVAGLLEPAAGSVTLQDGGEEWPDIQSACHFLSTNNAMKPALSVRENLDFWQKFCGHAHMNVDESLEMVGLEHTHDLPFGYLSTGQRRRIAICRLLVAYRPIWLLDEPTSGLDASSEAGFADLMQVHLEDGGIVVAATHLPLRLAGAQLLKMGDT